MKIRAEGLGRRTAELLLLRGAGELFCDLLGDALTGDEIDEAVAFLRAEGEYVCLVSIQQFFAMA